jgi:hypothetical protein
MSLLGLDTESVLASLKTEQDRFSLPTHAQALWTGCLGFGATSLIVFGVWGFGGQWMYMNLGEGGFYGVCALLFVGLSGFILNRLVIGHRSLPRFYLLWAGAFGAYAVSWCLAWFTMPGKAGEWLGAILGSSAMGLILACAFGALRNVLRVILSLVLPNLIGYFLGDFLHRLADPPLSMFLWGAAYGFIWGLGIGEALYVCQESIRNRLQVSQLHPTPAS